MNSGVPARLRPAELMPPEDHLRPGASWGFWVRYFGLVGLLTISFMMLSYPGLSLLAVLGGLTTIAGTVGMRRSALKANEENQRGVNLLNAGEIDEAGRIFDDLARRRKRTHSHVFFVYNCAVAAMLAGRHQRALSIFNAVEASKKMRRRNLRPLLPNLYIEMGCCLALTNDLQGARGQLRRASELLRPPEDARLLFLEAIIAVRSGEYQSAVNRIEDQWRKAEGSLRSPTIRTLRLVYAHALEKLGQRDTDKFRNLVAGAQPARQRDFLWSTIDWPEFDAFVRQHIPE